MPVGGSSDTGGWKGGAAGKGHVGAAEGEARHGGSETANIKASNPKKLKMETQPTSQTSLPQDGDNDAEPQPEQFPSEELGTIVERDGGSINNSKASSEAGGGRLKQFKQKIGEKRSSSQRVCLGFKYLALG